MAERTSRARDARDAMNPHLPHTHLPGVRQRPGEGLAVPGDDTPPREVRRFLTVLGLPTFGLAFSLSIITTYGPVVLLEVAGTPGRVGALVGIEGAFALGVPLVAGIVSDRLSPEGLGKRLPFIFAGGPLLLLGALLLPVAPGYLTAGAALLVFFIGYYLYYPPYRAIYADLLPRPLYARSQSSQAVMRGAGLGVALLIGGVLLDLWEELPFLTVGVVVLLSSLSLRPIARLQRARSHGAEEHEPGSARAALGDRRLLLFFVANALLELSFAGLRTFVVLYVTQGLGHSNTTATAVIGVVAVAYIAGAPIAGRLSERFGVVPVMVVSAVLYGLGLSGGALFSSLGPLLVLLPFVALAGAVLLTLPQALAFLLAPAGSEGLAAASVDVSRGVGVVLGPVLVGLAVSNSAHGVFSSTHGYAAMWPVIGIAVLLAVPLLRLIGPVRAR